MSHSDCMIEPIAGSVGASIASRTARDFKGSCFDIVDPWQTGQEQVGGLGP